MRHCSNCGASLAPGVRFCSACGVPVAAAEANRNAAPRADDNDPTRLSDEEATRLARDEDATRLARDERGARDEEATRVAARSPFDDSRIAPARVERLGDTGTPNSASAARGAPPLYSPPAPSYDAQNYNQSAPQLAPPRQGAQPSARAVAAEDDAERVVFSVRPTMLFVGLGYALAALGAVGLTVLLARYSPLSALSSLVVSLPLLLVPAYYHLRRNTIKYTLTDSKIEIDRGLIARRTRNIPLRNIQDVTVSATIPQRLLGFGDLIVENASEVGGTTVMHNIPSPRRHAEMLLRELRRRT